MPPVIVKFAPSIIVFIANLFVVPLYWITAPSLKPEESTSVKSARATLPIFSVCAIILFGFPLTLAFKFAIT